MKIFAISGSLRAKSCNTAILHAANLLCPPNVEIQIFNQLGQIPLFNPDLRDGSSIPALKELRQGISSADAILIASPEYIHGVPGVLKNSFDWVVGTGELDGKPVGIINASTSYATWVRDSLQEILGVMSGWKVVAEACFVESGVKTKFDSNGNIIDPQLIEKIRNSILALVKAAGRNNKNNES